MRFQKRNRLSTKIQMKCHKCRKDCLPKNGDWHDGVDNQVFLCKICEPASRSSLATMARSPVSASRSLPGTLAV